MYKLFFGDEEDDEDDAALTNNNDNSLVTGGMPSLAFYQVYEKFSKMLCPDIIGSLSSMH